MEIWLASSGKTNWNVQCHPSPARRWAALGEHEFCSSTESVCPGPLLLWLDLEIQSVWAFELGNSFMSSKPKPLAQPSFYHWRKKKKKKYYASICYFSFFLSLHFFRILVEGKGTIYWTSHPEDPNTRSHFIDGLHLPNTVLMSVVTWAMSSQLSTVSAT